MGYCDKFCRSLISGVWLNSFQLKMTLKVFLPIQVGPGVSPLLECLCGVAVVRLLVGHRNPGSPGGVGRRGVGHPGGRIVEPPSRLFPWHDWQ